MSAELVLMRREHVQAAIKPVVTDLLPRDPEQILHRTVRIPALCDAQLRVLPAKARHREHAGHRRPRHLLPARLDQIGRQRVQPQPPPQRQPEKRLAETARPLHPHAAHIDHLPARPRRRVHRRLAQPHLPRHCRLPIEQRLKLLPTRLLPRLLARQLAQCRHHLLTRSRRRAPRLAQRPILIGLPGGVFAMAA